MKDITAGYYWMRESEVDPHGGDGWFVVKLIGEVPFLRVGFVTLRVGTCTQEWVQEWVERGILDGGIEIGPRIEEPPA